MPTYEVQLGKYEERTVTIEADTPHEAARAALEEVADGFDLVAVDVPSSPEASRWAYGTCSGCGRAILQGDVGFTVGEVGGPRCNACEYPAESP